MSSSYNNTNMRDYSMADAAMQSGVPDSEMQDSDMQDSNMQDSDIQDSNMQDSNMQDSNMQDSGTQDATMQDARPTFIAAAFAGLENSDSLLSMTSPNDSSFEGLMALLDNRLNSLDIERRSVGNKRVKPPTSRQNEDEQVQLDEADIDHAFACAEGRSRATDDTEDMLVAALTAAFEEDSMSGTSFSPRQQSPPPPSRREPLAPEQQLQLQQAVRALQTSHSENNPFYHKKMTLAWAATNIVTYFNEASELLSDWHMTQEPSTIVASSLKKTSTINRMWANVEWTLEFLVLGREGFNLLHLPDDFYAHMLPLIENTIARLTRVSQLKGCGPVVWKFRNIAARVEKVLLGLKAARGAQGKINWVWGHRG
jgi:uncharacterized protein YjbI with pentapeptide repeats